MLSNKEKLESKYILEELGKENTEMGVYLTKAIRDCPNIAEELKETFIKYFGNKEAESAHYRATYRLRHWYYDRKSDLFGRKPWWIFWSKDQTPHP